MTRYPTIYNKEYGLSNTNIDGITAVDTEEDKFYPPDRHVLYIGSAPIERMVALKGFFTSIKLNFQKDKENKEFSNQNQVYIVEKHGTLSYEVALDMPAHSVNESKNNIAKIEELQRYVNKGNLWSKTPIVEETEEPGPGGKPVKKDVTTGHSYDYVSSKFKTTVPLFFVFFRNIINGGRKFTSADINSFNDLAKKGFPCYIESIKFDPDVAAGFFEFDNFLYPKNIRLSLSLKYESETLFNPDDPILNNRTIKPFTIDSKITQYDSGLFPFHVNMKINEMNKLSEDGTYAKKDSFLFMCSPNNTSDVNSIWRNLTTKKSTPRYVVFDLFLEEFSRDLQYSFSLDQGGNSTVYSKVKQDLNKFKGLKYTTKINVVSNNIEEAKKNAAKIQYLARMFYKTFYDGTDITSVENTNNLTTTEILQSVLVYIPSFIETPTTTKAKSTSLKGMLNRSIPLYMEDFTFDINLDLGFFEEETNIYPKAYSLSLGFLRLENDLIYNYNYNGLDPDTKVPQWSLADGVDGAIVKESNAFLFPYNRKTIKL